MFKNIKIGMRLWLLVLIVMVALIATAAQSLLILRNTMLQDRQLKTQHVVETAIGVVTYYAGQVASNALDEQQAKTQALSVLRSLRYGDQEYFWVNTAEPRMVMHPMKPALDGSDVSGLKDPNGTIIFVEFAKKAKQGGGFVNYYWPKPGSEQAVAKISYVKLYEPWGWIIGSGIYIDDVDLEFMSVLRMFSGAIAVALALIGVVAWLTTRSITRPLSDAVQVAKALADGELGVKINTSAKDETGMLLSAMHMMVSKLSQIIGEVRSSAQALNSAAEQVSTTAQSMSQATSEQAASVEETSASVEQMSASINQNTDNANITDGMAAQASKQAVEGGAAVKETVAAMKQIAGKIGIIDDIAYQTNLLALNAAIEAARAGEHGKGFAVVAAEVRKLAERSQVAAQEISELAGGSVDKAESAGKLLDEIVPAIGKTSGMVQEIAAASSEQSSGVGQINTAMTQLNQITQQNASSSEELAATAEEMSSQAAQLQEVMSFFKVSGGSSHAHGSTFQARTPAKAAQPLQLASKKTIKTGPADEASFVRF